MRDSKHKAAMLKLASKGLNVGAEVLRYSGLCFFIIIITVSGPIIAFTTGSITWPALALALGAHFSKAN